MADPTENNNENQPDVAELQAKIDALESQVKVPDEYSFAAVRDKDAASFDEAFANDKLNETLASLKEEGYTQREAERELRAIVNDHNAAKLEAARNATNKENEDNRTLTDEEVEAGKQEVFTIMAREMQGEENLNNALANWKETLGRDFDPLVDRVQDFYNMTDKHTKAQLQAGNVNRVDPASKRLAVDIADTYNEQIRFKYDLPPFNADDKDIRRQYSKAVGEINQLHREGRINDESYNDFSDMINTSIVVPPPPTVINKMTGKPRYVVDRND